MNDVRSDTQKPESVDSAHLKVANQIKLALTHLLANPARAFLVVVGVFAALYSLASLSMPFGWDHGMLASVGADMARGEMPYRDSWEIKSPLAFLPYALSTLLFGHVMWGVRLMDLLIPAPLFFFFWRTVTRETEAVIGAGAVLGLYLLFASQTWFFTAQPDPWAAMLVAVGTCLTLAKAGQARPSPTRYFLAGLLIGAAGLIKPMYLAFGLAPLISAAFAPTGDRHGAVVRDMALLAAGAGAIFLACILYLAMGGALSGAIEVQIRYNIGSYAKADVQSPAGALWRFGWFFSRATITLLVLFSALAIWSQRNDKLFLAQLFAWILAGLVAVITQGKYYPSHWAAVFPSLVFCAALGVYAQVSAINAPPITRVLAALAYGLFLLHVSIEPARDIRNWGRYVLGASRIDYYSKYQHWWYNAADQWQAAEHILNNSASNDGLFVFGNEATIQFLANRPNPTRFNFNLPLLVEGPFLAPYRAEAMRELSASPPKFIVVGVSWDANEKGDGLERFPEFRDFLAKHYAFDVAFGNSKLFRRKDAAN